MFCRSLFVLLYFFFWPLLLGSCCSVFSFLCSLWVDTSAGEILAPDGITRSVVSASALTRFIRYIYYLNLQFLNNVVIDKTKVLELHTVYNSCLVNYITNPNSNEYKLTAIVLDIAGHILFKPSVFSGVRVTRSLVLYVCFVDRCMSFFPFSFGHCVFCSSSIYGFRVNLVTNPVISRE
jgi:hypothetical protein